MNYDHAYHAGNPADVVKHAALALVLGELAQKDPAIHYVETHAGAGVFPLLDPAGEHSQGIGRLWSKTVRRKLPELSKWLDLLGREDQPLGTYLGSPSIARALLREKDRIELYELNPRDAAALRENVAGDKRVVIRQLDGWRGLDAARPFVKEAKLVVLVDPPFESVSEWDAIDETFVRAATELGNAPLLLWYPIKAGPPHEGRPENLRERLESAGTRGLSIELRLRGGLVAPKATNPRVRPGLVGTGLMLVNAPHRAVSRLTASLPELARAMARTGGWEVTLTGWAAPSRSPEAS